MRHTTPVPGDKAPNLTVDVLGGAALELAGTTPEKMSLVFFYRGVHCPICKTQLEELNDKRAGFEAMGISVHAVSMDSRERAERQRQEWKIDDLPIGYGLSEESAREWGLFISGQEKDSEPARFAEPGIAMIYPDGTIYALHFQSVPFARPTLDGLKKGLSFILENDYPIRGKVAA
ncbi:redoxin domain-containing protein [Aurantimonas marianensis]|uniref:Redoxin domain-containing protein n=1 Tax=Aurantimonas marianensis TaxID=2920428 RepID=A0A9X2H988_9HYPH|nr:redoxin domain-containing protein [Aurantimonas marianensis]MCP3056113.1 redoxin domain-containing protein [Aurantimonas marianensis]